jgi:hypothetical protein
VRATRVAWLMAVRVGVVCFLFFCLFSFFLFVCLFAFSGFLFNVGPLPLKHNIFCHLFKKSFVRWRRLAHTVESCWNQLR